MSAFEPTALDMWARQPPHRFCSNTSQSNLFRSVTLGYVTHFTFKHISPELSDALDALVTPWGIDPKRCDRPASCDDLTTPWGLALFRLNEYIDWARRDGWNRDGSLSRQFNRIPYEDWTPQPYTPRNPPWLLSNPNAWQPLLEHNGRGFLFSQRHVTPYIGQYGRSIFLADNIYCALRAPPPRYNYNKELRLLVARSASMAENEVKKAKVELFDNKLTSLLVLQVNLLFARGVSGDSWEFIELDMVGGSILYETVMLVWREKVRHDAIRPKTRLHYQYGKRNIVAYAGPNQGRKRLRADEWDSYIRTMPHSEYPSASACFCKSFAEAMRLQFGEDTFTVNRKVVELSLVLEKGKSMAEPGQPKRRIVLKYSKWSDAARDCGVSRLDGGLHFTAAVSEGEKLCAPVGRIVSESVRKLVAGQRPTFVQPYSAKLKRTARCKGSM